MRNSISRCISIAIALAAVLPGVPASGGFIAGAGVAPTGANDIDVFYADGTGNPSAHIVHSGTTIDGNPAPTVKPEGQGIGMARWVGPMNGGTVYGWSLESSSPITLMNWYFTDNGDQIGPNYKSPTARIAFGSGTSGPFTLGVANADPSTPMSITNFQVFVGQSMSIEDNALAFADFSTSPFTGSAVAGIPSSFTLDASNPTMFFTPSDYPGLTTGPNTLVFIEGTVNGTSMFREEGSVVPEPSSITMVGIGLTSVVYAFCRRSQAAKSRSRDLGQRR